MTCLPSAQLTIRILKVFALIDKIDFAYNTFGSKIVQPAVSALVPKEKSEEAIRNFYESLSAWISETDVCKTVRESGFEVGQSVSFLVHAIVPSILEDVIAPQMAYIYSPGIPNIFLRVSFDFVL